MKTIIISTTITIMILITCCLQGPPQYLTDVEVGEKHNYSFEHDMEIENKSPESIMIYVSRYLELVNSPNSWLLPETTYLTKEGDCVEFVGLWMYLIENEIGYDTWMIVLENDKGQSHTVGYANNLYYDIQCENESEADGIIIYGNVKYMIPYAEYIWMAYYYGKNVGKYF